MKRYAALMLAVVFFAAPTVALADWSGPSLEQIFGDTYVETILFGE
ncbi:MAG: hypothetical protein ACE1Z6_07765 [Candidatus Methylomirabilales bacterium]|jgi:hypothetical protein|nr:hypothetical protein [candidate division NC10 bacterium]